MAGRSTDGNTLALQFARSAPGGSPCSQTASPPDHPAADENPLFPLWRTVGVDDADIPAGADRVRIRATDARTDAFGWLAVTGPRRRTIVSLTQYLATHGPVLISWAQSFLFPCVHDTAAVDGGVAQTPLTVIDSPRPHLTESRDPTVGGTFSELAVYGDLHEIPTRLLGHPDLDWGTLLISADPAARDAYHTTLTEVTVPGLGGSPHPPPQR